ncbi:MAG TPA: tRNA (guanosine(37)-N1)-methyltransferase TrmD [Solirubrobacterales bacterium]|nr:tRNA (guanosine(37)-N1)-methyltransferase TrmD [Solirubrobacterales bacterium]
MRLDFFTLFPEAFDWFRSQRPVRNAEAAGVELRFFSWRDTTPIGAGKVDDSPYGGGAGMVLRVDVVDAALREAYGEAERPRVVLLTPAGRLLDDALVGELAGESHLALLSGRYEGFDQRIHDHLADDEVSIGRYVLAGGELPAMVLADAVIRRLPGALGHEDSAVEESFSAALGGAPEYPQYTRPPSYRGWDVPDVLVSGDHERVREWRLEQSRQRAAGLGDAD